MEACGPRVQVTQVPGGRDEAHALLRDRVGAVSVGRLCPRCGSSDHGRPWVRVAAGVAPAVSISYAAGLALLAWSWDGAVGVDLEATGADAGVYGDLATWTRAEAVLKATGEGLLRDPADLPPSLPGIWERPLDLGPSLVAHLAVSVGGVGVPGARATPRRAPRGRRRSR